MSPRVALSVAGRGQAPSNEGAKLRWLDRFRDDSVTPGLTSSLVIDVRAEEYDRYMIVCRIGSQKPCQRQAVHPRQVQIHEQQLRLPRRHRDLHVLRTGDAPDVESVRGQE